MKRKILGCLLVLTMVIAMTPVTAMAATDNYVEVKVTYTDGYADAAVGEDSGQARMALAEEVLDQQFASLEEAAAAFLSLYDKTGTYGKYEFGGFNNVGAFYVHVNDKTDYPSEHVFRHPVACVEYIVHGTVPALAADSTAKSISLGHNGSEGRATAPEIILRGADENAKLTGEVSVSARVGGGYPDLFTEEGTFTVEGLEFTNESGNTVIEADGTTMGGPDGKFADTVLNVKNNVFHNTYYSYVNDRTSETLTKNITDNKFIGDDVGTYAYFVQGQATNINFERNTIEGYARGLNIHLENDDADVRIADNKIATDSRGCGSVQLTNARNVSLTGNEITNPSGAAIRFYYSPSVKYDALKTEISDNYIDCAYLFQTGDSAEEAVKFDDNNELIFTDNIVTRDTNITSTPTDDGEYTNDLPDIVVEGDKRELNAYIAKVEGTAADKYTDDSYAEFAAALAAAKSVSDDKEAVQADVDKAYADLEAAYEGLALKPDSETPAEPPATGDTDADADADSDADATEPADVEKTGDSGNIMLWLALMILAAGGALGYCASVHGVFRKNS